MHTLFDFITQVKAIEYIVGILSIGVFILFWEILKAKPFRTVAETGRDDMNFIRQSGYRKTLNNIGKIAAAPFIGLAYVVIVPVGFFIALLLAVVDLSMKGAGAVMGLFGKHVAFDWRPMEAYFTGMKKKETARKEPSDDECDDRQ